MTHEQAERPIAVASKDIQTLAKLTSKLVEWKHSVGPLCPPEVGEVIFRLSLLCLCILAPVRRSDGQAD